MAIRFRHVSRGGRYVRVVDPSWRDPLDGSYAAERGGRWNPPRSFPVVYLCASSAVARAYVLRTFAGLPYGPLDLRSDRRPQLATAQVPRARPIDVVTDAGCRAAGLPATYPLDERGRPVAWDRCRPVGAAAHARGEPGIACRSATLLADEELAWLTDHGGPLPLVDRRPFEDWFTPRGDDDADAV